MILWGSLSGRGACCGGRRCRCCAPHEEIASWLYCFAHAVGEPSSHRQRRRFAQREDAGRNPSATYATRVTLTAPGPFISPSLSSETSCTAQSEQSLGSARRAPARIRDHVGLNHTIRCLHWLLLREATVGLPKARPCRSEQSLPPQHRRRSSAILALSFLQKTGFSNVYLVTHVCLPQALASRCDVWWALICMCG